MIEVFNLNHYIIDATGSDPDKSAILNGSIMYSVSGTSPDRVAFTNSMVYSIAGATQSLPKVAMGVMTAFLLEGGAPGNNGVVFTSVTGFLISGGEGSNVDRIATTSTSMYLIT